MVIVYMSGQKNHLDCSECIARMELSWTSCICMSKCSYHIILAKYYWTLMVLNISNALKIFSVTVILESWTYTMIAIRFTELHTDCTGAVFFKYIIYFWLFKKCAQIVSSCMLWIAQIVVIACLPIICVLKHMFWHHFILNWSTETLKIIRLWFVKVCSNTNLEYFFNAQTHVLALKLYIFDVCSFWMLKHEFWHDCPKVFILDVLKRCSNHQFNNMHARTSVSACNCIFQIFRVIHIQI